MLAEPIENILYEHSWQNLILYSAATPQYDDEKEEELPFDDRLDCCADENLATTLEDEYV